MSNKASLVNVSSKTKIDIRVDIELWRKHSLFELFKYTHFHDVNTINIDLDLIDKFPPDIAKDYFDFVISK